MSPCQELRSGSSILRVLLLAPGYTCMIRLSCQRQHRFLSIICSCYATVQGHLLSKRNSSCIIEHIDYTAEIDHHYETGKPLRRSEGTSAGLREICLLSTLALVADETQPQAFSCSLAYAANDGSRHAWTLQTDRGGRSRICQNHPSWYVVMCKQNISLAIPYDACRASFEYETIVRAIYL